jgi:hypothetical protein
MTRVLLVLAGLLVATTTARADDLIWGSAYQNPWSSWDAYRYKSVEAAARARIGGETDTADTTPAPPRHRPLRATDFKRSGKGRPALDAYLASVGLEGDKAEQVRALLEAGIVEIEGQVRKNNVASSMGVLLTAANYVLTGVELDDAAQDAMVETLNDQLAADRSFGKLRAKERQLFSDTMLVQSAVILVLASAGQTDAAAAEASRTAARDALRFLTGTEPATPQP